MFFFEYLDKKIMMIFVKYLILIQKAVIYILVFIQTTLNSYIEVKFVERYDYAMLVGTLVAE